MAPAQFRKLFCLAAGWLTLIQAVLWEVLAIYSIGVYSCFWNFIGIEQGTSTWSLLYISYFMGGCKSKADAQYLGFNLTPPADPARNLQVWMWIYAVFTAIFIAACILFIIAASCEVRGSAGALLYYPWICLSAALLLLDLAGTIYHAVDIFSTTTQDNFAQFVANMDWASLSSESSDGIVSWLPSLYIVLLFSRLIVIWLLNLFLVHGVFKACSAVATDSKQTQSVTDKTYSWRDMLYKGTEPELVTYPSTPTRSEPDRRAGLPRDVQRTSTKEKFDIPKVATNIQHAKETAYPLSEVSRPPLTPTGVSRQLSRTEPMSPRRKDVMPSASGPMVATEISKSEPFSYIAGDQPQLMRRPVSRSNSHREYPRIPERDYTIADRRSLEYVPNRFRVPSPKRAMSQRQLAESHQIHTRSHGNISQPAIISQPEYYSRDSTQNDNYNINKLY